jgi:hypothetical protein
VDDRPAEDDRLAEHDRLAEEERRRRRRRVRAATAAAAIAVALVVIIVVITRDPPNEGVAVPADRDWTDTSIDLESGDVVEITSDGTITHDPNDPVEVGPDGDDRPALREFNVLPDTNHAALIGRIGAEGDAFLVGAEVRFTAPNGGRLFLGINDLGVSGNTGNFTSEITLVEP